MTVLPDYWQRAAANAVWPSLRRGRWLRHDLKTTFHPTGNPRSNPYPQPSFPPAFPSTEVVERRPYILAFVWPEDWPAGVALRVELQRADHDRVLAALPAGERAEYEAALAVSNARRVFYAKVNRHGNRVLRRNGEDGAITAGVARALEAIVEAADVTLIPPEVIAALISERDDVTAAMVSLPAVQVAALRGAET